MFFKSTKEATKDFTNSDLPQTRKEQFRDILVTRITSLFVCGCLLLLFFIPTLVLVIFRDAILFNIVNTYADDALKMQSLINTLKLSFSSCLIVSLIIFGIAISGVFKIYKNMIWGQPVFIKHDFFLGIKENFFHVAVSLLFIGLGNLIVELAGIYRDAGGLAFVNYLVSGFTMVFIYPVFYKLAYYKTYYSNGQLKSISSAFNIYILSIFSTLSCLSMIYFSGFLALIPNHFVKYIVYIVMILIASPVALLVWQLNEVRVFDKLINKSTYVNVYRRGLSLQEKK